MIKIHYPTAFKALNNYIDTFNKTVTKRSSRIISSTTLAAKEIVRIYGVSLLKYSGVVNKEAKTLPPLRTNNKQLAGMVKCSTRSIQRHITRLLSAGILTKKVFHGSNSSYELWINPDVLFSNDKKEEKEVAEDRYKNSNISPPERNLSVSKTICPNTYFACYNNNIINSVHDVEFVQSSKSDKNFVTGYSVTGHTGKKSWLGEKGSGGGDPLDPTRATTLNFYVCKLWVVARNVLYKDVYISPEQEAIAKNQLSKFYEDVSEALLPRVHEIYIERIQLVLRYLKKDPNRYVQLPYKYFDVNNPGGFVGTKKWWKIYNARKQEVQKKLILHAQIKKYNGNLQKPADRQRPYIDVFRECEQRIGKLNDPTLLNEFHSIVLPPNLYKCLNQA